MCLAAACGGGRDVRGAAPQFVDGVRSRLYCLLLNYIFWAAQKFAIFNLHKRLFLQ
jgi:hypothetical protein